ncbi:MAG: trigger factor [Acidobacteriota bacterium]|nr:trigger factor [Acidobacteriota bacterium]
MLKQEVVITDVSQCQKDLAIEIAAEEVTKEFEKNYDAYMRYVKVPGFRPGRVPRGVVKQRFSKEIKDEVIGHLLPHAMEHAVKDHNLKIIGDPQIQDFSLEEGQPLKFKVSIEVLPEIELKEYKGLKATKRVAKVTDEEVERVIERWRENEADLVPVEDRSSQHGDIVSINLVGKYLDPQAEHEKEDLKADGMEIEIGGKASLPEFTEHLSGVKPDDVKEFRVAYPEEFGSKGLAGKTIDFTATVLAIRQKELPELNDEFAKDVGDYESLQDMRDKVRENLVRNAELEADNVLRDDLLAQLLDSHEFEVPNVLVNQQAESRLQDFSYRLQQMGMPADMIQNINWEERFNESLESARRDVRSALLVGRIGMAEKVTVGEEEIDAEIEAMAESMGRSAEELKARLTRDEAVSSIETRLRYRKALDVVVSNADITTEEVTRESLAAAKQETSEAQAPSEQAE